MMSSPGGMAPGTPESRTGAFDTGLTNDSQRFNAKVPKAAIQTSVLQPARPSANGMSSTDYDRVLPGGFTLPSANGSSPASYEKSMVMQLRGREM